jgi:hypothetical protein
MIIIKLQAGLCNQLFQWAYGYALSKKYEVYFDTSFYQHQDPNHPVDTREYDIPKIIKGNVPLLNKEVTQKFSDKKVQVVLDNFDFKEPVIDDSLNYYFNGYWQCSGYFEKYRDEILDLFDWPKAQDFDFTDSCSIHIRRGDYVGLQHIHPLQPISYYEKAVELINPKGNIFVFSDDINWCKENLKFDNMIFMENNHRIEDLHYMSLCSDNVIANSSFSWWGAWLNQNPNKIVVCPKKWFGDNTNDNFIKSKDWIQI